MTAPRGVQARPSFEAAMCRRVVWPSNPAYAITYSAGVRTTLGDSTPYRSLSPESPASIAIP
jgi:hypothetical protein